MSTYKLGERVKILSGKLCKPQWITGCVVYGRNNKVLIKYDSNWAKSIGDDYEWIADEADKIQYLNLESLRYDYKMVSFKSLECQQQPTYFKSEKTNNDYLIIISSQSECNYNSNNRRSNMHRIGSNYIMMHDISAKHYEYIGEYPSVDVVDDDMSHILDKQHELLYVFDNKFCDFLFVFDLNHKTWDVKMKNDDGHRKRDGHSLSGPYCISGCGVFVQQSINEIHTVQLQRNDDSYFIQHKKYDEAVNKFVTMSKICDIGGDYNMSMFYIESLEQMVVFCGPSIFYCHIKEKDQATYLWKKSPIRLPMEYSLVLVHDHIAIIYPYHIDEVYCVDLLYHEFYYS